MAIRWIMSGKEIGLAAIGAGPRSHYLKDNGEEVMLVFPIGGSWRAEFKGYKFKILFGENKFRVSKTLFNNFSDAKIAAKKYYLEHKGEMNG
jgi:hypothetical protein